MTIDVVWQDPRLKRISQYLPKFTTLTPFTSFLKFLNEKLVLGSRKCQSLLPKFGHVKYKVLGAPTPSIVFCQCNFHIYLLFQNFKCNMYVTVSYWKFDLRCFIRTVYEQTVCKFSLERYYQGFIQSTGSHNLWFTYQVLQSNIWMRKHWTLIDFLFQAFYLFTPVPYPCRH